MATAITTASVLTSSGRTYRMVKHNANPKTIGLRNSSTGLLCSKLSHIHSHSTNHSEFNTLRNSRSKITLNYLHENIVYTECSNELFVESCHRRTRLVRKIVFSAVTFLVEHLACLEMLEKCSIHKLFSHDTVYVVCTTVSHDVPWSHISFARWEKQRFSSVVLAAGLRLNMHVSKRSQCFLDSVCVVYHLRLTSQSRCQMRGISVSRGL